MSDVLAPILEVVQLPFAYLLDFDDELHALLDVFPIAVLFSSTDASK